MNTRFSKSLVTIAVSAIVTCLASPAFSSSHREAPFITTMPKVDASDFYMFNSYEQGRDGYVTFVANYLPLQDAYGGPNYFDLDDDALYEIHIDNDGDAVEDITFGFNFDTTNNDVQLDIDGTMVSVPLKAVGGIGPSSTDLAAANSYQSYTLDMTMGDRRSGSKLAVVDQTTGSESFIKPFDNIGNKTFADYASYASYAASHIYPISIPNCTSSGRVFVGQRQESFAVNLGEVFDLVNLNPLAASDSSENTLADKNVTSLILELPAACLTNGSETVIGAWTTASLKQARVLNPTPSPLSDKGPAVSGGAWTQVSRLGMPLVNEVVIGLKDKNLFNASEPAADGQFATYVTHPTFPALLEILFPGTAVAPKMFPRTDLVAAFLTGVDGLNQPSAIVGSEMLRLNTAIEATPMADQENLGVLAGDLAGFPNGRRPGDDVVDSVLRVAMGALIQDAAIAPNNSAPLTDGAKVDAHDFMASFPYLNSPIAGAGH